MITPPDTLVRCPACNPIHVGGSFGTMRTKTRRAKPAACWMCHGSRRVELRTSELYVSAINGEPITARPRDVDAAAE